MRVGNIDSGEVSNFFFFDFISCHKQNKKTRQAVREATLRNKDPKEMLKELEQIDKLGDMDYLIKIKILVMVMVVVSLHSIESKAGTGDVPHENALRERRRRVTESLSRVLRYLVL